MRLVASLAMSVLTTCVSTSALSEQVLFQSASLGPAGITPLEARQGVGSGLSMGSDIFLGARFELTTTAITTAIGGHVLAEVDLDGTFFGAIVKLDGPDDLPDSTDLSTPDVLGTTSLVFPDPSDDAFGELSLELDPGWYGVIFGAGLFGTDGLGGMPRNNPVANATSFFAMRVGLPWATPPIGLYDGSRFVVRGLPVPEPLAMAMTGTLVIGLWCGRVRC